jgi:glycosyltransferase involved in cell wall biosynthesis
MKLSIIIPAYNEEKRIRTTLENLVERFNESCEILVVSESADETDDIVINFSETAPLVKLIASEKRLGKGGAFKKGFENSRGEVVMLLDSDLPVLVSDVENVLSSIGEADVAIASREIEGTRILVYPPLVRVFAGKVYAKFVNILFSLNVKDPQCGCKAFRKEVLEKVLPTVESNGFEFDTELLFWCKKMGYKIEEIPVNWSHKPDSKLNLFEDTFNMGKGVLKLWLKSRTATQKS